MRRVLLIDSSELASEEWLTGFHGNLYAVVHARDLAQADTLLDQGVFDLVIVGTIGRDPWEGVRAAAAIRSKSASLPVFLIPSDSSEALAMAAIRAGVTGYLRLTMQSRELRLFVAGLLSAEPAPRDRSAAVSGEAGNTLVGVSKSIQDLRSYLGKVGPANCTVLITGETGTGKELVAGQIHACSLRKRKPFISLNCAAIPDSLLESELFGYEKGAFTSAFGASEGKLRQADGGTVFFDEIGEMSGYAQAKLLRLIESKEIQRLGSKSNLPVDIRIVAATNQDIEQLVAEKKFRKDLFFRLNVARIHVPPLRERKEDLPTLLDHYLRRFRGTAGQLIQGFTDEAMVRLLRYNWPGNVRELKNSLEVMCLNDPAGKIGMDDLPPAIAGYNADAPESDRDRLLAALRSTKWNKSNAAKKLSWSRMTLYRKIAQYGIRCPDTEFIPDS